MEELIKWLQEVGPHVGTYPDDLYKEGVELCERYSKNQAIKATFRVVRPTPLHKKLLRNTLKSTADLLERHPEIGKKKAGSCSDGMIPDGPRPQKPAATAGGRSVSDGQKAPAKKAPGPKPTPKTKSAKDTRK